ncbi:hypothetical protein V495_08847 [Pseudogymnoascus sp. VKM F-4514 (FW-929)]|nr:hypothetical protein V495_08847 [Pseudogymnoascus sp. VKM F-4514 (FW-929)]KFY60774.1 hypothetical protein V497_03372 [Pseudogymnoascus sp. VKM F-4516 (FW-969)]
MAPILLPSNQPQDRFYRGGAQISAFRSEASCGPRQPEDWVASTTSCRGCQPSKIGMTTLPDGRLLDDIIRADPKHWLGEEHIKSHGVDTKLLLKLLDAGQRLPVHAHPHACWAKKHVGTSHGKAEAWYILTPGEIYLGLKEDVTSEELLEIVNTQNIEAILLKMHRISVQPHQVVYVPPGTLHAIGQGILLVELQEPEDLSILVEWKGFEINGEKDGHLGLGFPIALTAVDRQARSREYITGLVTTASHGSVVANEADEYFSLERVPVTGIQRSRRGFAIVVVLDGDLTMVAGNGHLVLKKGSTAVVPHEEGDIQFEGLGDVLIARPPQ